MVRIIRVACKSTCAIFDVTTVCVCRTCSSSIMSMRLRDYTPLPSSSSTSLQKRLKLNQHIVPGHGGPSKLRPYKVLSDEPLKIGDRGLGQDSGRSNTRLRQVCISSASDNDNDSEENEDDGDSDDDTNDKSEDDGDCDGDDDDGNVSDCSEQAEDRPDDGPYDARFAAT